MREKVNEANQVVIVDLADANNVLRRPITADAAIMHPHQKILALRGAYRMSVWCGGVLTHTLAGRTLQVFNIETKQKVKSHVNNEDITFWKWISDSTLGLVTETAVYHWSITDSEYL